MEEQMSDDTRRGFTSLARAWYRNQLDPELMDSFTVGMYCDDGGCDYEFEIEVFDLCGKATARLRIYDDAFAVFENDRDLFAAIAKLDASSPEAVTRTLLACGYTDRTETQAPHTGKPAKRCTQCGAKLARTGAAAPDRPQDTE
jgi:hypothetical protein